MRFLLHAASTASRSTAFRGSTVGSTVRAAAAQSASAAAKRAPTAPDATPRVGAVSASRAAKVATSTAPSPRRAEVSWGQKCSPRCGCVVRFESTIDASTNRIVSAEYHAKSVVVSVDGDGILLPRRTSRGGGGGGGASSVGRPLLTKCRCSNLHRLASAIALYLPGRNVDGIRNSAEYDGFRSSESFRRTVLNAQGLPRTAGHCYDLVEEAFLAGMRGYVPGPRKATTETEGKSRARRTADGGGESESDDDGGAERKLDPRRYARAARRAGRVYRAGASAVNMPNYSIGPSAAASASVDDMPAFHMDVGIDSGLMSKYDDVLDELCREIEGRGNAPKGHDKPEEDEECSDMEETPGNAALDWVSYVDELHRAEEEGEDFGRRRSA